MPRGSQDTTHEWGELQPVARFRWERILLRCEFAAEMVKCSSVKLVGLVMATYADAETGDRVHPGIKRLMDGTGLSDRQVRRAIDELKRNGLLFQRTSGSNLGRSAKASVYQLSCPEDMLDAVERAPDQPILLERMWHQTGQTERQPEQEQWPY